MKLVPANITLAALAAAAAGLVACTTYEPVPVPVAVATPVPVAVGVPVDASAVAPLGTCFRTTEIRNHTVGDDRTLYVGVGINDVYRVSMASNCLAGAFPSDPLVIRPTPASMLVCRPIDLDISISKHGFASPCIVDNIVQLTPTEIAALPPKLRP